MIKIRHIFNIRYILTFFAGVSAVLSVIIYMYQAKFIAADYQDHREYIFFLVSTIGILIILSLLIRARIKRLWRNDDFRKMGTSMQRRIIIIFSVLAATPSLILAMMAGYFYYNVIQSWYDSKVSSAIENSVSVADAYLKEHAANLQRDAYIISRDLTRNLHNLKKSDEELKKFLNFQTAWRGINEAFLFSRKDIVASTANSAEFLFSVSDVNNADLIRADKGEIVLDFTKSNKVRALIRVQTRENFEAIDNSLNSDKVSFSDGQSLRKDNDILKGENLTIDDIIGPLPADYREQEIFVSSNSLEKSYTQPLPVLEQGHIYNEPMQEDNLSNVYLFISKYVDPQVLAHSRNTKKSANEYKKIKQRLLITQNYFAIIFATVSLILIFSAILIGLNFAPAIVAPLRKLIEATERVRGGDLTVRLVQDRKNDEISTLFNAFNRMTSDIQKNRVQLNDVHQQTEQRRRLIEAIFSAVSSGIISLDEHKRVKLCNNAALDALKSIDRNVTGRFIADIFPEMTLIFSKIKKSSSKIHNEAIDIKRNGMIFNLNVRVIVEKFFNQVEGYVITIDDITDLANAQRIAAWSDVARRIAHEIKNPLTPITLSAGRIKNKYLQDLKPEQREDFERYINTIIKHSQTIENIVKEFSNFAKMPKAMLQKNNINELIGDIVFSEKVVNPQIEYIYRTDNNELWFDFDKEQMSQVLINLMKNAAESLRENKIDSPTITIELLEDKNIILKIMDNGKGFPNELINRLTEPYVTTRDKGTGLGLAIVKRILDEHGASLELSNLYDDTKIIDDNGQEILVAQGAKITITFRNSMRNNDL